MSPKTLLLTLALALCFPAAVFAQGRFLGGPVQLFHPFAASKNAAATFTGNPAAFPLAAVGQGSAGSVELLSNASFVYTPGPSFSGHDQFSYTVTAPDGSPVTGTVTLIDFALLKGTYFLPYTLFSPASQTETDTYGMLTLTAGGAYSLRLFTFRPVLHSAAFDQYGNTSFSYAQSENDEPVVSLSLSGAGLISGQLESFSYSAIFGPSGRIVPSGQFAGRYTALPGLGWMILGVTPAGLLSGVGQNEDGILFVATGAVLSGAAFSLYSVQNFGQPAAGPYIPALFASATFRDIPGVSDFDGAAGPLSFIGSRLIPAAPGQHLLRFSQPQGTARVTLTSVPDIGSISVAPGDMVTSTTSPITAFTFNAATATSHGSAVFTASGGQFSGSYFDLLPTEIAAWTQSFPSSDLAEDTSANLTIALPEAYVPPPPQSEFLYGVALAPNPSEPGAPVLDRITNPGFELPLSDGWTVTTSGATAYVKEAGYGTSDLYPTQGAQYLLLTAGYDPAPGDYASISQNVDFTGISALSFDLYLDSGATAGIVAEVLIDNTVIWSFPRDSNQQAIDVSSAGAGVHRLEFRESITEDTEGQFGLLYLDNLQAFGPLTFQSAGTLVSSPIVPEPFTEWNQLFYDTSIPSGTALTVDILDPNGHLLARNVASGAHLNAIPAVARQKVIALRANLSTAVPGRTPTLAQWEVYWLTAPPAPVRGSFRGVVFQKQNFALGEYFDPQYGESSVIINPE